MEFRLLGDVGVLVDGRPVDVGHARQRVVLAALLLDVNRVVGADQLVERVWADRPPHRARNALSAYVSRLRQLLAGANGVRIIRGPAGYTLVAEAESVDLHRFRALVARARAADQPATAAALYGEALGLWRGELFVMADTPWFAGVRTSLEAERTAVALDRNDAALRAGMHADLVGELVVAVRAHPLDERLTGQLMLAQYRSGRQAKAFGTYEGMRERLRDELGADPGPALRRVHQQILTGDADAPDPPQRVAVSAAEPAAGPISESAVGPRPEPDAEPVLAAPAAAEPALPEPDPPAIAALPRRLTSLVGRGADVERVTAAVRDGPLVTLTGVGGVGKTRLALEAADATHPFVDGVWFCELAPVHDPGAVGHAVAGALRVQQRRGRTIEQTVVEYLACRELLLVVDNCEHVLDAAARLVDQVVRHCPKVAVLATSREPLGVDGERILPVEPLAPVDAAALFADRARAQRPDVRLDSDAVRAVVEICRRLDGLPLGIELVASRMRVLSVVEVAARLAADVRIVSGGPRGAPERHRSLVAAVGWSYRLLSAPEQALFARLSVFAGGFDLDAAHGVCGDVGSSDDDTFDLLVGLVDKSMVAADPATATTRYRMLETMRRYGRERLAEAGELDQVRERHGRYFADFTERAALGLRGPNEGVWVERLTPCYDDLRVAVQWATITEDADLALRLVAALPDFAYWRVGFELAEWSEAALALPGARTHPLSAAGYGVAAIGAWGRGEFPRATRLALATGAAEWVQTSSRGNQPSDVLAYVAADSGHPDDAVAHFERRVELARPAGDPVQLSWVLGALSSYRARAGDLAGSRRAAEEALAVARAIGNPTALALGLLTVGLALTQTEPDGAVAFLDESAAAAESVRNRWFAALARMEATGIRAVHAEPVAAAEALGEVLDDWDRLGDRNQVWRCLHLVTPLLVRLGADEDAVVLHHAVVAAGREAPLDAVRLAAVAEDLGRERFDAAARRGCALDETAAVTLARSGLSHAAADPACRRQRVSST
ncbi:MAG: AfsR/SARP family transcriptional regulator [Pseudonocardia sp.]